MTDPFEAACLSAATEALAQFPVVAESMELFAVSENITLRVCERGTGELHALRLHRPGYNSLAELVSERQWTAALGESGIVVQAGIAARSGELFVPVVIPGLQEQRYAGLTRWLPGKPLSDALESSTDSIDVAEAFRRIGHLAASMHEQSAAWSVPEGFTRPRLGVDGLLGENPRWGRFWEHTALSEADGRLLRETRALLIARLRAYGETPENFGLVHADLHPENLVMHGRELSVIDFDDSAFGWYGYDLATALVEVWGTEAYETLRRALLSGYRDRRYLSERHEQMLDTFILLRGMAIIGWFAQRPEHNDSDYFPQIRDRVLAACADLCNPQAL